MSSSFKKTINRLENYKGSPSPILSVYFQLPIPKKYSNTTIVNKLQAIINANLTYEQREEVKKNIEYIVGFMENYQQKRGEKTIAFFSGGDNLFDVIHIPSKLKNYAKYSHDPYLEPLLHVNEDNRRYFVILNDRKKTIFYTLYSGSVEEQVIITDDDVPQDVSGRWPNSPRAAKNDKVQRHIQDHLHRHFSLIAEKASEFIKRKPINGVVLGGHKGEMSQFENHLPKSLKDKVVGKFVSSLYVNFNEIVDRSKEAIEKANKRFDQEINPSPL